MRLINHAEGELLHTKYPPTVGGTAGNVSLGQNPVERKQLLSLSLSPSPSHTQTCSSVSHHMWLFAVFALTYSDRLCVFFFGFFLVFLRWLPIKAETEMSKQSWISVFRWYFLHHWHVSRGSHFWTFTGCTCTHGGIGTKYPSIAKKVQIAASPLNDGRK